MFNQTQNIVYSSYLVRLWRLYIGISKMSCGFSVSRTIPSRVGSNSESIDCASSISTSLELKFA